VKEEIKKILIDIGEDPQREGLLKTPQRVEEVFRFLSSGHKVDLGKLLNNALFKVDYDEMVIVKNIEMYSLCEHHLLPFFGRCHVGYLPNKYVIGLSKIPRIVETFSRRLQVQERLTQQIAETITNSIDPKGVAVVIEGQHLCMMMRGVEKQNTQMITSAMLGRFRNDSRSRSEFFSLIGISP